MSTLNITQLDKPTQAVAIVDSSGNQLTSFGVGGTPGTASTSLGKAEDAPAASGDTGVLMLAVRTPVTPTAQTNNDGDYGAPALDQFGDTKSLLVDSTGTPLIYNTNGRNAAASSTPVVASTEDFNEAKRASSGTKANVASSATSVTLAAQNLNRKTILIANESTAILYIDLTGGTASATSYSLALGPTATSIAPVATINNYTGAITGIWVSANGSARVTELS